ncbi:MAG: hypothetical protein HC882_04790 [Acidobacteria bacterium]|nr:hypothetical protein [Acidobacteriota bacterium]
MQPTRRAFSLALALSLALSLAGAAREKETWRYEGVSRVVAIGDVHGAFDELTSVLRGVGLIDDQLTWSGGSTHLVMLGDLVDRGPRSIDVLELLIALQPQAKKAGGRVHVVLGNHEAMLLTRDLRYVTEADYPALHRRRTRGGSPGGMERAQGTSVLSREETSPRRAHFDALYPPGFFGHLRALSAEGRYGSWLLDQRIAVVIDETLFIHGGLSPVLLEVPPDRLNERAQSELRDFASRRERLERAGVIAPETPFAEAHALLEDRLLLGKWNAIQHEDLPCPEDVTHTLECPGDR